MDSLTQIVLGAAMGELVLGKKVGNRAMLWGAIGGTIPDLDIIAYSFTEPIEALAMHRGISHSLMFGLLFPWLIAWWPFKIYDSGLYKKLWFRWIAQGGVWLLGIAFVALVFQIGTEVFQLNQYVMILVWIIVAGLYGFQIFKNRIQKEPITIQASYREWAFLFIASIFTHPILDAFTAYGTQLFLPFSDYRVALNTISVADPLYTIPFLFCLIVAAVMSRSSSKRTLWTLAGITISSFYLIITVWNRQRLNGVVERTASAHNLSIDRCMAAPTIFNNLLWHTAIETPDAYHHGLYSFLDENDYVTQLTRVEKYHERAAPIEGTRGMDILQWFTNDYYTVEMDADTIVIHDLRYGTAGKPIDGEPQYIFSFTAKPQADGTYYFEELRNRPDDGGDLLGELWERMMGIQAESD